MCRAPERERGEVRASLRRTRYKKITRASQVGEIRQESGERESRRDILFMCVGLKWNGTLLLASNYNLNCLGNLGRNAINRLKITVRRGKNTVKLQQVQLFELQVQSY